MTTMTTTPRDLEISTEVFRRSESGHVYGIVDDPAHDIGGIVFELLAADVPSEAIHVYRSCECGPDDAGCDRPVLLTRIHRALQSADGHLRTVTAELARGRALIGVAVEDEGRHEIAQILRRHGAHDVVHYGRFTWQALGA